MRRARPEDGSRIIALDRELARFEKLRPPDDEEARRLLSWIFEAKNTFTIPGVGKLVLVNRKARMGRNPATGEVIQIKAKRVVKFRVSKKAKDAILGPKK